MSRPTPVPAANGIYFWWFKEIPSGVPTEGCITQNGYTLLYVGISPDKKANRIAVPIFDNASKPTIAETPKAQHSDVRSEFYWRRKAISRSVGLVREKE